MSRIVVTRALGGSAQVEEALGLGRSLKLIGDDTVRAVISDTPTPDFDRCFHRVLTSSDELEEYGQVLELSPKLLAFRRLDSIFQSLASSSSFEAEGIRYRTSASHSKGPTTLDWMGTARNAVRELEIDIRTNQCRWVEAVGTDLWLVMPVLFRPACSEAERAYLRALADLEALDRYEQTHGFGYVSPWHKFERSVQKRILKFQKRL